MLNCVTTRVIAVVVPSAFIIWWIITASWIALGLTLAFLGLDIIGLILLPIIHAAVCDSPEDDDVENSDSDDEDTEEPIPEPTLTPRWLVWQCIIGLFMDLIVWPCVFVGIGWIHSNRVFVWIGSIMLIMVGLTAIGWAFFERLEWREPVLRIAGIVSLMPVFIGAMMGSPILMGIGGITTMTMTAVIGIHLSYPDVSYSSLWTFMRS